MASRILVLTLTSMIGLSLATSGARLMAQSQASPAESNLAKSSLVASTTHETPSELFKNRIMPIFRSEKPSSCVQCHLASVDLKNYILPSSDQTFVALRDQGLIDLETPEKSKILTLIRMGEKDFDKGARLIHEKMRKAEYEAFASWIRASAADERLRSLPRSVASEQAGPPVPDVVVRHGRKGRILNSFVRNIWSQRMRCFPCHTPHDIRANQKKPLENFERLEGEYGDRMLLFKKTPLETVKYLIERSLEEDEEEYPLINLDEPTKSLLVLKPTSKLPPRSKNGKFEPPGYKDPVSHMGGLKMHRDDQSYKSFINWIEDYSRVVKGKYKSAEDLPKDNWFATRRVLRVREFPAGWKVGTTVQLMVHNWNADENEWDSEPMAFTQGTITPRRMVNGSLFLLAPTDLEARRAWLADRRKLSPGKYQIRVYVDANQRIQDEPTVLLGKDDYVGAAVIDAKWQLGFPKAENVSGKDLAK